MQRLAGLLIVVASACSASGPPSGAATLTGSPKAVMSAGTNSFSGPDAAGTKVLGWTIYLFENGPGADCNSGDTKVVGTIGIFTNQADDGTKKKAMLATGDLPIVAMSPPSTSNGTAAAMGLDTINTISGLVSLTEFYVKADGTVDHISGTVTASGMDSGGTSVALNGMFVAPNCD